MWHFVYKLFNWHLSWLKHRLNDYMRHDIFIHVYFMLKLIVKEEGMIPCSVNWGVYTAIMPHQRAPNHAIHCLNFLNKKELIGKMILCFLSTVTIYKTGNSQLSSTRALVKTMLFLFGTHAYWTESPVQNLFLVWIRVSQYHYWASLLCQKKLFIWSWLCNANVLVYGVEISLYWSISHLYFLSKGVKFVDIWLPLVFQYYFILCVRETSVPTSLEFCLWTSVVAVAL